MTYSAFFQAVSEEMMSAMMDMENKFSEIQGKGDIAVEEMASILCEMHMLKGSMSMVYEKATSVMSSIMNDIPEVSLSNGAKIEKKTASDRRSWRHKDLAGEVAKRISEMSIDMDTGEKAMSTEEMISSMLEYLQPSYWRVTALSKIGVNADNFCEVLEPKSSIIVRSNKK